MTNNNFEINQTQFAAQEPLLDGETTTKELNQEGVDNLSSPKKKSKKLMMVGVIGLVLMVVFILLLILLKFNSSEEQQIKETLEGKTIQEIGELSPFLKEVYILSQELKAADPVLEVIPFPPLDMELRLEKKQ